MSSVSFINDNSVDSVSRSVTCTWRGVFYSITEEILRIQFLRTALTRLSSESDYSPGQHPGQHKDDFNCVSNVDFSRYLTVHCHV